MKTYLKSILNITCAVSLLLMVGCVPLLIGAAVGGAGVTYVNGVLVRNIDESVKVTHEASVKGLKDLGLYITSDELNTRSASIIAETEKGKTIRVNINALTEYVAELRIRVGMFGDKDFSHDVLTAIQRNL